MIFDNEVSRSIKLTDFSSLPSAKQHAIVEKFTAFYVDGMRFSKVNYLAGTKMLIWFVMFFVFLFFLKDMPKQSREEIETEKKAIEKAAESMRYQVCDIINLFLPQDKQSLKYGDEEKSRKLESYK